MAQHGALTTSPLRRGPRLRLNLLVVGDCAGARASAHGSFPGDPYPSRGPADLLIFMSLLPCLSLILLFPCFVKTFLSLVREFIEFPRQLHHSFCCSTTITLFYQTPVRIYVSFVTIVEGLEVFARNRKRTTVLEFTETKSTRIHRRQSQ
jgi:hypothetical protein